MKRNEELIQAVKFAVADLASGGELNAEQREEFIRAAVEQTVILKEARYEPMDREVEEFHKIGFANRVLQKPSGTYGTTETGVDPATGMVTLTAVKTVMAVDIGLDVFKKNIERDRIKDTIISAMAEKAGVDLEELIIMGDTTSAEPFYTINEGLFKLAGTHEYDHSSADFEPHTVFKGMLNLLPKKYLRRKAEWCFYVHEEIELLYRQWLADRLTGAGDRYLLEDIPVFYMGIPVIPVPMIVESGSGADAVSSSLLVHPKNILYGVLQDITIKAEEKFREQYVAVTGTLWTDVQFEEEDAVVEGKNIKHTLASS
ncbi:MAG: phage major capsid protein [Candidatus Zixiibacteriota bacterium]